MDIEIKFRWKRRYGVFAAALVIMAVVLIRITIPDAQGMAVTFHNSSELSIESIKLDFGNANSQSTIRAFRIAPEEDRKLLLNHEPGMGFNVEVTYQGGIKQSFCALRGDDQADPTLYLKP